MAEARSLDSQLDGLTLRGVLLILFGFAAIFWPGLTIVTFVYIFSAFILVSGIMSMVTSLVDMSKDPYWFLNLIAGLLELGIGVYLLRHINVGLATFILLIGLVLVVRGVVEFVRAISQRDSSNHRILMGLVGIITALAGLIVLREPVSGGIAFVWVVGLYALITGPMLIALAHGVRAEVSTSRR
jgi:uncharacterized membrane protein HdeD (DUF308 family)